MGQACPAAPLGRDVEVRWLLLVPGFLIVIVAMVDALQTTLSVGSVAGPVTGRINHRAWSLVLATGSRRLLRLAGVPLTLNALGLWLLMLWLGWTLVFSADPTAVMTSDNRPVSDFGEHAYFAGSTLFSLGSGEFHPNGTPWRLLSVLALINGLFLVTLGITYVIPVATAATERRRMAALIASLGNRPDEAVAGGWDDGNFGALRHYLMTLAPDIALLAQRHLAYPVLHYFHSGSLHTAAAPMIARLDELVTLLRIGLEESERPDPYVTRPLHEALTQFLNTLHAVFVDPRDEAPPPPRLDRLRAAGLPVVSDEVFTRELQAHDARRRLLLALVENDGWDWSDVWPEDSGEHEPTGHGEG